MATEIQVPIRLKVLQDSISEFQKILNNLQPNTNNWKALNKIISSMSAEVQKLQAQMSMPFSSEKQFTQANKTIDKLEETATRISVVMQGLQFSDIKLTPEQINQFTKFEEEINKIRESYKKLQDETKGKLFAVEKNQSLLGNIGKGTLEKDFEGLESAVENHIKKLDSQIKSRNEKLAELRSDKVLGDSATSLITKGMSVESIGEDVFNKYLRHTKDGMLTMNFGDKGVSKQALLNAIGEMYHLEPGELQKTIEESLGKSLKSINAEEINNVFKNMNKSGIFSGIIKRGKESAGKIPLQNQETEEIRAQLEEYRTLAKEMQVLSQQANLPGASVDTSARITEITTRMRELETTILNGARTNSTYTSSMQQLISQFPQLRSILESTNTQFLKMQQVQNTFNSMKNTIANFMGFYQVLNLTKKAIREAANHIKELDTVMNKISIVTDMDTSDLWGQIDQYSKMAQTYGTTIKGAYEVSQIYYQQGLETADVLTLTNETLKLAKISGLDYASTTDYMTTAIRGFKMEMQDAETVVDVYSALAANTAVSQEELAVAMSKTASSMESVGSTFQETSAMIATMVAVTRESATNIGSAMKSIASRYGELTKDPSKLVDSEGEAMAFNKVDAALQSVGISMKTAEGQFREFTDVIVELGEKWAELDSVQQRYIATQFAGNRQQSRFLALVSNIDLLKQNIDVAENSEDVGNVQALKALDSLESKIEQVRVAYQQFYTTIGIEDVWKTFLDGAKSVVNTLNGMPKLFGKIPVAAINAIAQIVTLIKNVAFSALAKIANQIGNVLVQGTNNSLPQAQKAGESWVESVIQGAKGAMGKATSTGQLLGEYLNRGLLGSRTTSQFNTTQLLGWNERLGNGTNDITRSQIGLEMKDAGYLSTAGFTAFNSSAESATTMLATFMQQAQLTSARIQTLSNSLMGLGSALSLVSLSINTSTQGGKRASGVFMALSGVITGVAAAAKAVDGGLKAIPWYAVASAIISVISGITQFIEANSPAAALEEATTKAEELQNKAKELKADYNTLNNSIKKYNELEKSRYDSAEAAKEYQEQVDKLADAYPELVQRYNENNQAVLNVNAMEEMLAKARDESAAATLRAAQAEADKAKAAKVNVQNKLHTENDDLQNNYTHNPLNLPDWAQAHPDSVNQSDIIGGIVSEENRINLQKLIQGMVDESEAGNAEGVIQYYEQLVNLAKELDISFSDGLRKAIEKTRNVAYEVIDQDTIIDVANRATVSAFMNDYYGSENSNISAFKDNSGLMTAATDTLYNSVWNEHYDTITLMEIADSIFSGIDALYSGISENRRAEIDSILNNPSHYSGEDIKILLPELANTTWLIEYFNKQISYNKDQLTNKIEQLRTNRQNYENGKIDESLTLLPKQIQQFEDAITENITLDLRNLMTSGINQAQNLKKTGQNPQAFIDNFIQFYNQVSALPAELRNNLISQFSANGFTNEGMIKTLDWIKENEAIQEKINLGEVDFSSLEQMATSFIPTYSLTVASLEDSLTNNLDDIESIFADLQSGIKGSKLGKTIAKAQELGLDLERSDFKEDGDTFVLRYEKFADLISHIDDIYTMALPEEGEFEKAYKNLTRIVFGDKLVDLHRVQDIQTILGLTYYDYFDANDQLKAGITNEQVYDALEKAYVSTSADLEQYQAWLKIIEQHLTKTIDWKHGDYSTLEGKVDLTQTDESGAAIDTAYKRVQYLAAHPDAYTEGELKEADVSNAVETYQKGMGSLITDLSKYGAQYLISRGEAYDGVASETVSEIQQLAASGTNGVVNAIRKYGHQAGMTVTEINDAIIKALGSGKGTSVANMISGRKTTLNDINSFLSSYDPDRSIEDFLDEKQNLQGALAQVYDYNNLTGELKLKRNATLKSVIAAYSEALGVDITQDADLLQQVTQQWITDLIAENDKNDVGKQMSSTLSTLSSAKVGTRVDLSKSPELQAKLEELGYNVTDGYYEVISEYARDSMILQLESTDTEVNATLRPLQEQIRQKRAKGAATQGIMGQTATREAFRNYLQYSRGIAGAAIYQDSTIDAFAKLHGYVWDEDLQQYTATLEALTSADKEIQEAIKSGASDEYIKQLREKRGELAAHFRKDEKRNALSNVLSNYEDAANYIDDLYTQFGEGFSPEDLKEKGVLTEVNGKQVINIEKLQELVDNYDDLFEEVINQIADEYINNISKAGSLLTQGTTSKTEMSAFEKAYTELTGKSTNFFYDSIIDAWTISAADMRTYIEKAATSMNFASDADRQDYINAQIKAFTIDNLDFSKYLSGDSSAKDRETLERNLKNYYDASGIVSYDIAKDLETLSAGGITAIEKLQSIKGELTTEEIEAAYRTQVAPLVAISEKLSELQAGSVVAKNQINALKAAGFIVDEHGIVTSTGDLVTAYRSLLAQMHDANGNLTATIKEANTTLGNLLDNRDGEQQAIDALSNASNMTYSQFAQIFTNAGQELTEEMVNQYQASGIIKHLGGNKMMIADFERFAKSMGWEANSEEYINTLSAYRDGIISYDKKMGDNIRANFDAITNAKVGDKINLTQLLSKFPEFEAELEATFGDIITDGVLTVRDALTLPQLAVAIGNKAVQEGGMLAEELEAFVASVHDNILNGITGAFDYSTNGTNSIASMQAFAQEYNTLTHENKDYSELFGYDTILNTFILRQDILNTYIKAEKAQLESLGLFGEGAIDEYIKDQTDTILRSNIELDSFLNADTNKSRNDEANKLIQQIRGLSNYRDIAIQAGHNIVQDVAWRQAMIGKSVAEKQQLTILHILESGGQAAVDLFKQIKPDASSNEIQAVFNSRINKLNDVLGQVGDLVAGQFVGTEGKLYEVLSRASAVDDNGVVKAGFDMVEVYTSIYAEMTKTAGATTAGLNDVYAKLLTAQDQANIDITEALQNGNGMSYADFGNLLAKYDIKFEDYMAQHYDTIMRDGFGNIRITDWEGFAKNIFKTNNLNAIRNTDEYISAFKAYNDGLIELNRKAEENITSEITSLTQAKGGDWINLANFSSEYERLRKGLLDQTTHEDGVSAALRLNSVFNDLNTSLQSYGATLENGILKLSDNANLLGIAKTIQSMAKTAGMDLKDGFAEIADSIQEVLKSYSEAIKKGIEGGLTNVERAGLESKAMDLGITNLNFTETAEGLKLSEQSAIALYTALKRVDGLQASLVFDSLKTSLEEANENFASSSSLVNYLVRTTRELQTADSKVSDARLKQYSAELQVAQEILAVRATQEDNSFNFMSNDIPAAQKNPLNYAKNWTQALHTIRDAYSAANGTKDGKTGFMEYQDYYNIVTELNNIAGISGQAITIGQDIYGDALKLDGSLEAASKAIQAGCDSLTAIDTGDLKVNIGQIGLNIESGANEMEAGVTAGIQAVAKSQVDMLDGLIAMLEIIVAMEQLGDITGDDNTIDLGDIFVLEDSDDVTSQITGFTEKFDEGRKKLLKFVAANKDLKKQFEHTTINLGGTARNMLEMLGEGMDSNQLFNSLFNNNNLTNEQKRNVQESYQKLINGLYQAAVSGEYDLDDITTSVKKIISESGLDLSDFTYEITDDKGTVTRMITFMGETAIDIDFTDDDTRKQVNKLMNEKYNNVDEYRAAVQDALKEYNDPKKKDDGTIDFEAWYRARTLIGLASNEFVLSTDKEGNTIGYYNGQKFTGDQDTILENMAKAAVLTDKGFEVTVDNGTTVKAKTIISGTEVEVQLDKNGNIEYNYNGNTYPTEEALVQQLATDGRADKAGTWTTTLNDDTTQTVTAQYDQTLGIIYSYIITTGPDGKKERFVYEGHEFDTYEQLSKAQNFIQSFDPQKTGEWSDDNKVYSVAVQAGNIRIQTQYNVETGETTLNIGNKPVRVEDQAALKQYFDIVKKQGFTDTTTELDNSIYNRSAREFEYYYNDQIKIKGEINLLTGKSKYSYYSADGKTLLGSSDSAEALEYVIGKFEADKVSDVISGKTVTYNVEGHEVELIVDSTGKIILSKESEEKLRKDGGDVLKQVQEAIDAANANTSATLEETVQANASKVEITLSENSEITFMDENMVAEIESITVKPKEVIVDTSTSKVNVDINTPDEHIKKLHLTRKDRPDAPQSIMQDDWSTPEPITQEVQVVGEGAVTNALNKLRDDISSSGVAEAIEGMASRGSNAVSQMAKNFGLASLSITTHIILLQSLVTSAFTTIMTLVNNTQTHVSLTGDLAINTPWGVLSGVSGFKGLEGFLTLTTNVEPAEDPQQVIEQAAEGAKTELQVEVPEGAREEAEAVFADLKATIAQPSVDPIWEALRAVAFIATVTLVADTSKLPQQAIVTGPEAPAATGNIGLAKAQGTLMGELGPELVVSNGRYFVAGQNGPEMVNLSDDAIVFNHLQTKSLLEKGMSSGRGKAVTNERNAVAFAHGNVDGGPAMASASAALAALKQLRGQWAALAQLSMKDLAGKGGSGGGGGGDKNFIKELERWYNWLQKIAQLEKDINYYEAERNRISSEWAPNGHEYYESQKRTLTALREQLKIQNDLTKSQEAYFQKRRAELNSDKNPFASLYTFDENGQLQYKDGKFAQLSKLVGTNKFNQANYTPEEMYKYITETLGIDKRYLEYDSSGNKLESDDYAGMMQAFWDKMESDKEEMQSLHDSVEEGYLKLENLQQQQNEIMKEMRDNQMELETKVYDAIVDMRQRTIDEMTDTKDAIADQNSRYIKGLSDALQKERTMYDNAESRKDLDRLRRQRDVLVRSGGSAAEISSLNDQIADQEQSVYFDKQQEEIDAIQAASDKQIEKLEAQIKLETEILEYQKKYGLLWSEVTVIMSKSPQEIADFIKKNDSDYWDKSPVSSAEALNELRFSSEQWVSYRDDGSGLGEDIQTIRRALTGEDTGKDGTDTGKEGTDQEGEKPTGGGDKPTGGDNKPTKGEEPKKAASFIRYQFTDKGDVGHEMLPIFTDGPHRSQAKIVAHNKRKKVTTGGTKTCYCDKCGHYMGLNTESGTEEAQYTRQPTFPGGEMGDPKEDPSDVLTGKLYYHGQNQRQARFEFDDLQSDPLNNPISVNGSIGGLAPSNLQGLYGDFWKNIQASSIEMALLHDQPQIGLSPSVYDSIAQNSQQVTVIEHADVNLNIDKLANDYDSRQAARTVMDEMLRIASKTNANNSVRR